MYMYIHAEIHARVGGGGARYAETDIHGLCVGNSGRKKRHGKTPESKKRLHSLSFFFVLERVQEESVSMGQYNKKHRHPCEKQLALSV